MIRPSSTGVGTRGGQATGQARGGDRSQTAVVAMVLLVGLVTIGVVSILVVGGLTLEEQQDESETTRIEYTFLELDHAVDSRADPLVEEVVAPRPQGPQRSYSNRDGEID